MKRKKSNNVSRVAVLLLVWALVLVTMRNVTAEVKCNKFPGKGTKKEKVKDESPVVSYYDPDQPWTMAGCLIL